MAGGILDQARSRLPQRWQQQALPSLYGVDNYGQLAGTQSHAQFAAQAGHQLPTDYDGNRVQATGNYTPHTPGGSGGAGGAGGELACVSQGGTWDPVQGVCILPDKDRDPFEADPVKYTGLYEGVVPGQSNTTVDDIEMIPTLGGGDVLGAKIFEPGSSLTDTNYLPWDQEVKDYNTQSGKNLFGDVLGKVIPGAGGILGGGQEAISPNTTVAINEHGAKLSVGYGEGQVEPQIAAAQGYKVVPNEVAQKLIEQPQTIKEVVKALFGQLKDTLGSGGNKADKAFASGTNYNPRGWEQYVNKPDPGDNSIAESKSALEAAIAAAQTQQQAASTAARTGGVATSVANHNRKSAADRAADNHAAASAAKAHHDRNIDTNRRAGWDSSVGNTGGSVGHAQIGNNPPQYSNDGGMTQHPGKPMGTDDVPAWLTEGEFVVDKDSAQKFAPLLEKINNYEPSGGFEGAMSEIDNLINKYAQGGLVT